MLIVEFDYNITNPDTIQVVFWDDDLERHCITTDFTPFHLSIADFVYHNKGDLSVEK